MYIISKIATKYLNRKKLSYPKNYQIPSSAHTRIRLNERSTQSISLKTLNLMVKTSYFPINLYL